MNSLSMSVGEIGFELTEKDTSGTEYRREDFIKKLAKSPKTSTYTVSYSLLRSGEEALVSTLSNFITADSGDDLLPEYDDKNINREISFYSLQEWEGYVVGISDDAFTARIFDLTNECSYEEEASFSKNDLSESDLSLLKLGAIFRWAVGYQRSRSGNKRRVSQIVFRQLPQWTKSEIEENKRKARRLGAILRGEYLDESGDGVC